MQSFSLAENSQHLLVLDTPSHADALEKSGLFKVFSVGTEIAVRPALNRVGIVVVGGTRYEVTPKLAISQLFFLMSYSAKDPFLPENYRSDKRDLWDLIARVFLARTHQAVGRGLLYDYVTVEDELPLVKGSIRVGDQMARRPLTPIPLEVTYDDYSPNILENKILKTALARVLMMPGLDPSVRQRLRALELVFAEVDSLPRGSRIPHWQVNRRNTGYQSALKLATIILENMSPGEGHGTHSMMSFVVNLPGVFEDFLATVMQESYLQLSHRSLSVKTQRKQKIDREQKIEIRPDILVEEDGHQIVVADAKYKVGDQDKSAANDDIYQMVTYCKHLGLKSGHLILAGSSQGGTTSTTHHLNGIGLKLHTYYLNLSASPENVIAQVANLAHRLVCSEGE